MSRWNAAAVAAAIGIACMVFATSAGAGIDRDLAALGLTALDEYVAAPDENYAYSVLETIDGDGYTGYVVELVSQAWLSEDLVDRPVWRHWLTMAVPDEVEHSTALLYIRGGRNTDDAPDSIPGEVVDAARVANSVAAQLRMIPNQPLTFLDDDPQPRVEDDLIAYAWVRFAETGDAEWLPRLPMTKSAVRAMDTVTSITSNPNVSPRPVETFAVVGSSKRGWTTWTTAAVDNRVVAFMPFVIDVLNMEPSMVHHYSAYGFWAPAINDYVHHEYMHWLGTPENQALLDIIEPYHFRERFVQPKYIVNSTGDQFFLPDSSQFYYDELPGEKLLRYVPNTDHGLGSDDDSYDVMRTYYAMILNDIPRPEYSWTVTDDNAIRVETETEPIAVKLWQATNPDARDFRLMTIGEAWVASALEPGEEGVYVGRVDEPESGWTAFMVELTFPGFEGRPLIVTTDVVVTPDTLPYADRVGEELPHAANIQR